MPEINLLDDPMIPDEELLFRAIHPSHVIGTQITSATFCSRSNSHPSVDRSNFSTPTQTLKRFPNSAGVIQIITGNVRALNLGVASAPLPDNPAHAVIIRNLSLSQGKWKELARQLVRASEWIIPPNSKPDLI
jgi:hypothetical protein